jgi:rhomboid protease GluP
VKIASRITPTIVLIFANISVYSFTSILSGNFFNTDLEVLSLFGQVNHLVSDGWYWQLFTAIFVHVNLTHLMMNMLFLFIFGLRTEKIFSKKLYTYIYFASGISGNLFTLLMGSYVVSAGASGAIFGIFGASTAYMGEAFGRSIITAIAYSFFMLILSSTAPSVNILAHLGGLLAGLIIGYIVAKSQSARA